MAAVYKLKYFEFMGVAEPIRYLLSYGGVHFENDFVKMEKEWPLIKNSFPFGKLPLLQVDDQTLFHSVAISHFLAARFHLVPEDEILAAEMEGIVEEIYEFGTKVYEWFTEEDKSKKMSLHTMLEVEFLPSYMHTLEEIVAKRGGYFAGKTVSWADLYFVGIMESVEGMWGKYLTPAKYPSLHQLYLRVHAIPEIKSYVAKRPTYKY